jgi:hypothetical protein
MDLDAGYILGGGGSYFTVPAFRLTGYNIGNSLSHLFAFRGLPNVDPRNARGFR